MYRRETKVLHREDRPINVGECRDNRVRNRRLLEIFETVLFMRDRRLSLFTTPMFRVGSRICQGFRHKFKLQCGRVNVCRVWRDCCVRGMRDISSRNIRNVRMAAMIELFSPRMLNFLKVRHKLRDDLLPYFHSGPTGRFVFASRRELPPSLEEFGHRRIVVGRELDFDDTVFARRTGAGRRSQCGIRGVRGCRRSLRMLVINRLLHRKSLAAPCPALLAVQAGVIGVSLVKHTLPQSQSKALIGVKYPCFATATILAFHTALRTELVISPHN